MTESEKIKALQTEQLIVCTAFYVGWAVVAFQGIKLSFSDDTFAFISIILFALIATIWESVAVFIIHKPRSRKDAASFLFALISLLIVLSPLTWGIAALMSAVGYSMINSMDLTTTAFWSGWLVGFSKGKLQRAEYISAAKRFAKSF